MFLMTVIKALSTRCLSSERRLWLSRTPPSLKTLIVDASAPKQVFFRWLFLMPFHREDQFKHCFELISDCFCVPPNLYRSVWGARGHTAFQVCKFRQDFFLILCPHLWIQYLYIIYVRSWGDDSGINCRVCQHQKPSLDLQQLTQKAVYEGTVCNPRAGWQRQADPWSLLISRSSQ